MQLEEGKLWAQLSAADAASQLSVELTQTKKLQEDPRLEEPSALKHPLVLSSF